MTWTNTDGGDHEGQDWIIDADTTIAGEHYNINNFIIESGVTVSQSQMDLDDSITGDESKAIIIRSNIIDIRGTVSGNGAGYWGGGDYTEGIYSNGFGPGGGYGYFGETDDGGGGGYGGSGGDGTAAGGGTYGSASTAYIRFGSGGGIGDAIKGGDGGGCILLYAQKITIDGNIYVNGDKGQGNYENGGGGGSGGGIFAFGKDVFIYGTLTANGGDGGGDGGQGGGGGGGRIKIFADTLDTTGSTITANGGAGYQSGSVGTYETYTIGAINSTHSIGQLFTSGKQLKSALKTATIYVKEITASGTVTCTLYDDTDRTTTLDSVSRTITSTGDNTFEFSEYNTLDADTSYFIEFTSDGTADIIVGIYTPSDVLGGSLYIGDNDVDKFDMYIKLGGYGHNTDLQIYNDSNPNRVLEPLNIALIGATHTVNANGLGNISYSDDFTSVKYLADIKDSSELTYNGTDERLEITQSGYVDYYIDTKYPIIGIPTMTANLVSIDASPIVQISYDDSGSPSNWYDIDETIVPSTFTEYGLYNAENVVFKGETKIWVRISSCAIESIAFNIDVATIDAEIPVIDVGNSNTFTAEQPNTSSPECTLTMTYGDRKWT